ncbi:MAG: IS630 family transposase [Pirellulaceae bacterium]|jgi:transposase|nr:IS630 family transposase [Pirellulaceae bacterium]
MSGKAANVSVTEKQQEILQQITRETTVARRLAQRARIIILALAGTLNMTIAIEVGLSRKQVGRWRRRWQQSFDALVAIECDETQAMLRRTVEDVLSDALRCGSPGTFNAEQVTQIIAIACEPPSQSGRPIETWTNRELADEAIQRGIVKSISTSQVNRYLAEADLQPHRSKYWLNTKEKDPEVFGRQVQTVCNTYLEAPELYFQYNTHTVSVDEMTGIQALERNAKTITMKPGQPARIEFEYTRHGTLCLIGNWDVVQGQMIAPTIRPTRTEEDFLWHIFHTVETDPDAGWVFVMDNLNTHCSESLVRYIAELEGIDQSTLGRKGKCGILQSMAIRQAFLSDRDHRVRFVFLPKHTSWLNQIEIVFGIVTRRLLRHSNFKSIGELKQRLTDFIEYFNRTFAKPMRWTYTGRPVKNERIKRAATWKEKWASRRQAGKTLALVGHQL